MPNTNPTTEEWRSVLGYLGNYEVSNLGRVRNAATYRILKPYPRRKYVTVDLPTSPKRVRHALVHVLVARAFLGLPPEGYEVNHKMGTQAGNGLDNLEYVTRSENNRHAFRVLGKIHPSGSRHGRAVLNESSVTEIRAKAEGQRRYGIVKALAIEYKVSTATVSEILNRRIWTHI